ncbi:protein FAM104A [Denticeps clupeoides]|uniref:protein FAM104A n=1 Tax=Denticeps clupeoides TaxID=299321 RepID=UPI0010A48CE1|nr:protein FAM104A-like [Denticeps clupeoides]
MLTESRKRRRSCDSEEGRYLPQTKKAVLPELGRDVWDSESSSSDSSGVSSPGGALRDPSSPPGPSHPAEEPRSSTSPGASSYQRINRILREAHFSSLQTRGQPGPT